MLTATRVQTDQGILIRLNGEVDENSDLENILGKLSGRVDIDCRDVKRMNSSGVRRWMQYFRNAIGLGAEVTLSSCSSVIVEQLNLVSDFGCGAKIQSVLLPYYCSGCSIETESLYLVDTLKDAAFKPEPKVCTICGHTTVFDDNTGYFHFLEWC